MEKIKYVDQNNNVYHITPSSIHYLPITPEQSSSGTYSGGEESKTSITAEVFDELSKMATEIMTNEKLHTNQRRMMTSMLFIYNKDDYSKFILPRSEVREAFEKKLKEIISNK